MKGIETLEEIADKDLDLIILKAKKSKGSIPLGVLTPNDLQSFLLLEVTKREKGWSRVSMDIYKTGWDITKEGQSFFCEKEKQIPDPEDRKEVFCGKRILRIDVKETGEGMILAYILNFLEVGKYLEFWRKKLLLK